jgi:hypothetical protein
VARRAASLVAQPDIVADMAVADIVEAGGGAPGPLCGKSTGTREAHAVIAMNFSRRNNDESERALGRAPHFMFL